MEYTAIRRKDKQKIHKLTALNDELENYFRNTIIPQLFVDANLILRKFSPSAREHFNFNESHIGKTMEEMIDSIRYSTIIDNIQEVIQTGKIFEKEIQTTDSRWFQMNIIPFVVKKGNKTNGVIVTFVDITERIKILKELERLNASHETFIYSVSHDLKGPLANIEALVQLLIKSTEGLSGNTDEEIGKQQFITELLVKSVNSMKGIISELGEIVKIEGDFKEYVETINIKSILNEVEVMLKSNIIESKANITYDISVNNIMYSKKSIRSILYNLLSNAIKFRHPGQAPEISVSVEENAGMLYIAVADQGMGMTKEQMGLIFTPFTRLKKEIEGTGIGLYLVKKIVENEDGHIAVSSNIDEGTRFIVCLTMK